MATSPKTVPVTVISDRAGLVMNPPDARVKLHGAQVGTVASIDSLPDGKAALHLAIDPAKVRIIPPANVNADITSSTVFGGEIRRATHARKPLRRACAIGTGHRR